MRRRPGVDDGFTVNQLVISLVVLLLLGGLWTVFSNREQSDRPQTSLIMGSSPNG